MVVMVVMVLMMTMRLWVISLVCCRVYVFMGCRYKEYDMKYVCMYIIVLAVKPFTVRYSIHCTAACDVHFVPLMRSVPFPSLSILVCTVLWIELDTTGVTEGSLPEHPKPLDSCGNLPRYP